MNKTLAFASLVAAASAAVAMPATAATPTTQAIASASIKKPLLISRVSDLSFGDILLSGSGTFSAVVSIGQDGTLTCPSTYFTCSGTKSAAVYNVSGNKSQQVNITADSSLTLTSANGTLTMAVDKPTSVTLTNSGAPGTNFGLGGSLTLTNLTPDGAYTGTFTVTAEYN